jgi:cytochrome oxidase Cu insertion factor (SCO1/SenC/PrrC family)
VKRLARCALLFCATAVLPGLLAQVPRPAPDFSISLPDGNKLPLKALKGKVVALFFISTT